MELSALSCYLGYVDYPVVVIYAKSVTSSMSLGIPLTCVKGRVVTIDVGACSHVSLSCGRVKFFYLVFSLLSFSRARASHLARCGQAPTDLLSCIKQLYGFWMEYWTTYNSHSIAYLP